MVARFIKYESYLVTCQQHTPKKCHTNPSINKPTNPSYLFSDPEPDTTMAPTEPADPFTHLPAFVRILWVIIITSAILYLRDEAFKPAIIRTLIASTFLTYSL